ncbi:MULTISPECIES: gamma subclass chorismate mutase AroQ [unclassified Pseudonocardia]|uniref:gamma subclass chorismate mutase AroQ n=1 Tax=unclassified Pseudonocardia TaxID=2619320 RepID=UPI0001FFEB1E|nr:gamma subclass chorismate mutase AroQ [Pseudonocardia sp. Ae707_Ps1]OLM16822.1 Periplasmic chorismate mutase I precursor [Pseudonocardia sp. Ae707_Ps1]
MTGIRRRAAVVAASVAVVALVAGCGDPPEPLTDGPAGAAPADGLTRVVDLAAERAVLSDRVAAAKAGTGQPVTDPAREKVVVDDARADAARDGVDPEWTARVFADQIAASTQVQEDLLRRWTEQPGARPAPVDLAQVRPELDRIGDELVAALKLATPARAHEDCASSLAQAAVTRSATLDDVHRAALGRALMSVCDGAPE